MGLLEPIFGLRAGFGFTRGNLVLPVNLAFVYRLDDHPHPGYGWLAANRFFRCNLFSRRLSGEC